MVSATMPKQKTPVPKYSWAVLVMLYLTAAAAALNMFKVSSLATVLMDPVGGLGIPVTDIGTLMSVFSVAGLILAIPGGLLVQRAGIKASLLIALGFLAVGSVVGVFASSYEILAATRLVEGVGFGLLGVAIPSGLAAWFPKDRRGLPLGIFTTWVPFGTLIMLVVAPALAAAFGWQGAWWFGLICAVAAFVVVLFAFHLPSEEEYVALHGEKPFVEGASKEEVTASFKASLRVLKDLRIWMLALVFAIFNAVSPGGTTNFLPTYLVEGVGMDLAMSNWTVAAMMIGVCLCEPLCGMLSDKIGSRKKVIVIPLMGLIVTSFFIFNPVLGFAGLVVCIFIHVSIFSSGVSTGTYAAAPELAGKPEHAGIANGMVAVGQNLGLLVGPLVFSNILAATGNDWLSVGWFWLVPAAAVAAVLSLFIKAR